MVYILYFLSCKLILSVILNYLYYSYEIDKNFIYVNPQNIPTKFLYFNTYTVFLYKVYKLFMGHLK